MKNSIFKLAILSLIVSLCACGIHTADNIGDESSRQPIGEDSKSAPEAPVSDIGSNSDETENTSPPEETPDEYFSRFDFTTEAENAEYIDLSSPNEYPSGVSKIGSQTIISAAGEYLVVGTIADGTLVIDVAKTEKVHLIFDGASISSSSSAAVWIKSADKVLITLKAGSENYISDGKYDHEAVGAPKGALYSEDDLTINGSGKLTVCGNSNNAVSVKNDLAIIGASIEASAIKNALKGNDSVRIKSAKLSLTAGKDGIKSDTINKPEKGFVYICDSSVDIAAGDDAIQAELYVRIPSGNVVCRAADLAINCDNEITVSSGCLIQK